MLNTIAMKLIILQMLFKATYFILFWNIKEKKNIQSYNSNEIILHLLLDYLLILPQRKIILLHFFIGLLHHNAFILLRHPEPVQEVIVIDLVQTFHPRHYTAESQIDLNLI